MAGLEAELIAHATRFLNKDDSDDSLHKYVDSETLKRMFVIHDRKIWKYLAFHSSSDYSIYRESLMPDDRFHHEVIWGDVPQRIKFDIDATDEQLSLVLNSDVPKIYRHLDKEVMNFNPSKIESIVLHISHVIIDVFSKEYGDELLYKPTFESNIWITDSSGDEKYSFHIVLVNFKLKNNIECKHFTRRVVEKLPLTYLPIIDQQVNKGVQTFRILGSLKERSKRCKCTSRLCQIHSEGFIQDGDDNDDVIKAKFDYNKEMRKDKYLSPENLEKIKEKVFDIWPEFARFRDERQGFLNFDRLMPSKCEVCDKVHDRDNTLLIFAETGTGGSITVKFGCRHKPDQPLRPFHQINPVPWNRLRSLELAVAQTIELVQNRERIFANYNPCNIVYDNSETIENIFDADRNISNNDLIFIRAGMKMGKTKALKKYIASLPLNKDNSVPSVCILSFRLTFSQEMKTKMGGDFRLYTDSTGPLNFRSHPKLILQIESLHRLSSRYDYVILDESESILGQFNSGNVRNLSIAFARFEVLLVKAQQIICMDAYLGERTIEVIKRIRGNDTPYKIYYNTYQNATGYKYELGHYHNNDYIGMQINNTLNEKVNLTPRIVHCLRKRGLPIELAQIVTQYNGVHYRKKRIAIIANSKIEIDTWSKYILEHHKDITESDIQKYTSATDAATKKVHMSCVDHFWKKRVVLYTPTITAGISFEIPWFDKIMAIFTNKSSDVLSCMQMLGRIRNLYDKHIIIGIDVKNINCSTTIESIKRDIESSRYSLIKDNNLQNITLESNMDTTSSKDGLDYKVVDSNYWVMWVHNTKNINLSKRRFVYQLCECILETGATIKTYGEDQNGGGIYQSLREIKKQIKGEEADEIAKIDLPTDDEWEEIIRKCHQNEELSHTESLQCTKRKLVVDYDMDIEDESSDIQLLKDPKFISKFNKPQLRTIYKNLKMIMFKPTFVESLQMINGLEFRQLVRIKSDNVIQSLNFKSQYNLHKTMVDLLALFGITNFRNQYNFTAECVVKILSKHYKIVDFTCCVHNRYPPSIKGRVGDDEYNKHAIKELNMILKSMYGHRFKGNKDKTMYHLHNSSSLQLTDKGPTIS